MLSRSVITAALALVGVANTAAFPPRDSNGAVHLHKRDNPKAEAIKEAYTHSWNGYVQFAFGHDELLSVSNQPSDSRNGWGASIADGLSTAILMEMPDVVLAQLNHIATIDFSHTKTTDDVSLFETTIRYLGGMLSGYDLLTGPYADLLPSNSTSLVKTLLTQSISLADNLAFAFNTPSGVPQNNLNFLSHSSTDTTNGIATIGTLVLEWTRLSDLTGNQTYAALAQKGESFLLNPQPALGQPFPGLLGTDVNINNGQFVDSGGSWSGGDDSFYEYLIKMFVYDPSRFSFYKDRWVKAVESTMIHMLSHPFNHPDITFVDQWQGTTAVIEQQQHLTCFIGGNFLLGGDILNRSDIFNAGLQLTSGCHDSYIGTATHIGPEVFSWDNSSVPSNQVAFFNRTGFWIVTSDYDLRPEVLESYYYAYRLTGDTKYQDWAWDAFLGINASCRTDSGYTEIADVNTPGGGQKLDFQESFWFAEVLKYLFLIFTDSARVGVTHGDNKFVFNTEAHVLKVAS